MIAERPQERQQPSNPKGQLHRHKNNQNVHTITLTAAHSTAL